MSDQLSTTKRNIALLSHLVQMIHLIVNADPHIMAVYSDRESGGQVQLEDSLATPEFFFKLGIAPRILARDSEEYPFAASAEIADITIFRLLTEDELREFDIDDPDEHFMDDDGKPKGYRLEQFLAEMEPRTQCEVDVEAEEAVKDAWDW
jgi:hypothetical protein